MLESTCCLPGSLTFPGPYKATVTEEAVLGYAIGKPRINMIAYHEVPILVVYCLKPVLPICETLMRDACQVAFDTAKTIRSA